MLIMGAELSTTQFFSSTQPPAVELPHFITALDAELIGKVAHLTKSKAGLWPVAAPYDDSDVFDRARESAPFNAWALPANQAEVLGFGPVVQEAIFGVKLMMLDANFNEATLARLAVTTGQRLETGAYITRGFQDLPELPQLVEQCGWALIPIGPERSRGLFVASQANAGWILKMQEWCEREGRNFGRVRQEQDKLVFHDQRASEKYRANAIAHRIDIFLGNVEVLFGDPDESILPEIERRLQFRRKLQADIARSRQGPVLRSSGTPESALGPQSTATAEGGPTPA